MNLINYTIFSIRILNSNYPPIHSSKTSGYDVKSLKGCHQQQ